ncbi:outer membrane protein [Methylobacterium sp. NPDC080182]|uniref:outer membrane protein n=1 Tax=Methylobacterium sp. NPDC080182 TaxID=3390590 RepID=UPI003D0096D3
MIQTMLLNSRALAALAAFGGVAAGSAQAADLPTRPLPPMAVVRPATFTWTGFYVGANAGYAMKVGEDYNLAVRPGYFPSAPAAVGAIRSERKGDGFLAGGQAGYNLQIGNFVIGAENDLQYLDLGKRRSSYSFAGSGPVPAGFNYVGPEKQTTYFATGRARIGYAFDNLLVYGTAGLSYGNLKGEYCIGKKCDDGKIGYVAGAGIEYALSQHWSVKVEGLYVNLGKAAVGVVGTDTAGRFYYDGRKLDNDVAIVRAGVNYRF